MYPGLQIIVESTVSEAVYATVRPANPECLEGRSLRSKTSGLLVCNIFAVWNQGRTVGETCSKF